MDAGSSVTLNLKVLLPETQPEGNNLLVLEPRFAEGLRVSPARSTIKVELKRSFFTALWRKSALLMLFILILAIACITVLVVVLYIRAAHKKSSEPIVEALIDSSAQRQEKIPENASSEKDVQAILKSAKTGGHRAVSLNAVQAVAHRDGAGAMELLASASRVASATGEQKAASTLDAWKRPPSSRHALPLVEKNLQTITPTHKASVQYQSRVKKQVASRIILRVTDQNENIGKRNIHTMQAGTRKSVGGSTSDFLVFLLPVPKNVAYLHFDGNDCVLVPEHPELFPDYDGPIEACFGKEIRMITPRNRELVLRFDRYISPIETINKLLHCIEVPGLRPVLSSLVDTKSDPDQNI